MKAKILLFAAILIIVSAFFVACTEKIPAVEIQAEDATNVKAGEYTLLYSIKNFDRLVTDYEARLTVKCYDEENNACIVKNNRTITVEIDKIYTIVITVTLISGENSKESRKEYTIEAVKTPPGLVFILAGEIIDTVFSEQKNMEIPLAYGASFNLSDLPRIPDYYTHVSDGIDLTILTKKWMVRRGGEYFDITQSDLENITKKLYIFGVYTYKRTELPLSIVFNTNGGTPVQTKTGNKHSMLLYPTERPVLEGYIFDKWYIDEELTTSFNWKSAEFTTSMTLYAGYVKDVDNPADDSLFNLTLQKDSRENVYYTIKPKDKSALPVDLVIPAGYQNIPVAHIVQNAFSSSNIQRVTIPEGITIMDLAAFDDCTFLTDVVFDGKSKLSYINDNAFRNCVSLVSINLPDTVTQIGAQSFKNCAFSSIVLPESLTRINTEAFFGCINLTNIEIPDAVTNIGQRSFSDCEKLENVLINKESALSQIANSAFDNTLILEITLPYGFSTLNPPPFNGKEITVYFHEEVVAEE